MANTRKSTKRAKQANVRNTQNRLIRSTTQTALRNALTALKEKDVAKAKLAYQGAIKALSKAGSKGALPAKRAARKISRLTLLAKRALPEMLKSTSK